MPPRRKRGREASEEDDQHVEQQQQNDAPPSPEQHQDAAGVPQERREAMAAIARRRAAHFAHYQVEEDDDQDNVHVGTNEARNLGPWSSAVELVNARDRAAAAREDKILKASRQEQQEDIEWEPKRDGSAGPRPAGAVPPLFATCLGLLVKYIDCVDSLWGVPDSITVRLAAAVCAQRKLTREAAKLFSAVAPSELVLPDCHQLDAAAMKEVLTQCATSKLERLSLGFCGRGFGDEAAALLAKRGPFPKLAALHLGGAYRLTDAGLQALLAAAPALQELSVPHASRVTAALVLALPQLAPQVKALDLTECRGIDAASLASALPQLVALRKLQLDGIPEVDDGLVATAARGPALRELAVRLCPGVGDASLAALAAQRPELEALAIDECSKVTDTGLRALAAGCKALRCLSARHCSRLSDEALAALAARGQLRELDVSGSPAAGPALMRALAQCCKDSLEVLDLSFCRQVPDNGVGLVADSCSRLRRLALFGCSQVTQRVLQGHCNEGLNQVVGAY